MKKCYLLLSLCIALSISYGGGTETEPQTPASCKITRYTDESNVVLNYNYNDAGLVASIDYQVSTVTGTLDLTWDNQRRLTKLSSPSTNVEIAYDANGSTATNIYTPRQSAGTTIQGSGEFRFNLNDNNQVTTAFREDTQFNKIEYNSEGQLEKVFYGAVGEEMLWAEVTDYDDKVNPFQELPIQFYVAFPNNNIQVAWQFEPWGISNHNAKRTLVYSTSGTVESVLDHEYNDLGYPVSQSGSFAANYTYNCE